ncbi:MAG: N-acetyltransferase family protein, partial [Bauldia sp.]
MDYRLATIDDAEGIARMHVKAWQESFRGLVPDAYLDSMNVEERIERWRNGTLASSPGRRSDVPTFAAFDGDVVVGFATFGPRRGDRIPHEGELWAIYVRRSHQGEGVGTSLLRLGMEHFKAHFISRMYAWVFRQNPALGWYLGRGAVVLPYTDEASYAGKALEEVAVG